MKKWKLVATGIALSICGGCALPSQKPEMIEPPVTKMEQVKAQESATMTEGKNYKRKLAIARFTNESNYGRALMTDDDYDRIGKQASDMLSAKLVKSGKFLVFERSDLKKVKNEQEINGAADLIGADVLIVGSVTEFGRSVGGKTGFLSSTKVQTARAKVDVRLVDTKTGQAFFSASGTGEASTESGEVAGFGSRADYDATLNDRAISAAIGDMIDKLVSSLNERPWKTDILEVKDRQIFISGGQRQGIKTGDILQIMEAGATVKSKQTGFNISLPAKKLAEIKVISFFGDNENNEGSVCELLTGTVNAGNLDNIFVEEVKK